MKYFLRTIFFSTLLIYSNMTIASGLDARDWALSICLRENYSKITTYKTENLKDYSHFNMQWSMNQQLALINFVEKEAGHFYQEDLPIHSDISAPPYNAIFQRCMEFYKSKKLNNFIKNNKPRASD